jgi:hypothetical protein
MGRDAVFRRADTGIIEAMEKTMKRTLIRYKTRPDAAEQNAGLIAKVFEELKAKAPNGVHYLSLRLDDDVEFLVAGAV